MSFIKSRTEDYPYLLWNEHFPFLNGLDSESDSFLPDLRARAAERPVPDSFCYVFDKDADRVIHIDDHVQQLIGVPAKAFDRSSERRKLDFLHPEDYAHFSNAIFPAYAELQRTLEPEQRSQFRSIFACRFRNPDDPSRYDSYRVLNVALHLNEQDLVAHDFGLVVRIPHELSNSHYAYCISKDNNPSTCHYFKPNSMFFPNVQPSLKGLSAREREILQLLSKGHSSREVSKRLFISSHTVDTHRRNMIKKTGVRNTVELVHLYRGGK